MARLEARWGGLVIPYTYWLLFTIESQTDFVGGASLPTAREASGASYTKIYTLLHNTVSFRPPPLLSHVRCSDLPKVADPGQPYADDAPDDHLEQNKN